MQDDNGDEKVKAHELREGFLQLEGWFHASVKPSGADDGHAGDYREDDADHYCADLVLGWGIGRRR